MSCRAGQALTLIGRVKEFFGALLCIIKCRPVGDEQLSRLDELLRQRAEAIYELYDLVNRAKMTDRRW